MVHGLRAGRRLAPLPGAARRRRLPTAGARRGDVGPGLYFVGMLFLHSFASMLVLGAGRDGERVAKHIAARCAAADGRRAREARRTQEEVAA